MQLRKVTADQGFVRTAVWKATAVMMVVAFTSLVAGMMIGRGSVNGGGLLVLAILFGINIMAVREVVAAIHDGADASSILSSLLERIADDVSAMASEDEIEHG